MILRYDLDDLEYDLEYIQETGHTFDFGRWVKVYLFKETREEGKSYLLINTSFDWFSIVYSLKKTQI